MNLLLAFLLLAQFTHHRNPGVQGGTPPTITSGAGCPLATGCAELNTEGTNSFIATITGSGSCPGGNCTLQFACTKDNWATFVAVAADSLTSGQMAGAPSTTTTSAGTFIAPTFGYPRCGVQASSYTSGTATIYLDADPGPSNPAGATGAAAPQVQGSKAASTPAAYTDIALVVAQRPTTVATAPTSGNLTAATATSVFSSTSGICEVDVTNLSSTIAMTCGQTNAVSLTVGAYVPPLATYREGPNYGGNVFCFPASSTPAYSVQATSCP